MRSFRKVFLDIVDVGGNWNGRSLGKDVQVYQMGPTGSENSKRRTQPLYTLENIWELTFSAFVQSVQYDKHQRKLGTQ